MPVNPAVGYMGGKRRLLSSILPLLERCPHEFWEHYFGMGAVYLALRASGYSGPAFAADANPCVRDYHVSLHNKQRAKELLAECARFNETPYTRERYKAMLKTPCPEGPQRTATFIWLTKFAFGNHPPVYLEEKQAWHNKGSRGEHEVDETTWPAVMERMTWITTLCAGKHFEMYDDAAKLDPPKKSYSYFDPPYLGTSGYVGEKKGGGSYIPLVIRCRSERVVLSETADLAGVLPSEFKTTEIALPGSFNNRDAPGGRKEYLYLRGKFPSPDVQTTLF